MGKTSEELLRRFGLLHASPASRTSTTPLSLPPSLALLAPTFPTFSALVTAAGKQPDSGPRRGGLFVDLLKDPQVLLQDLLAAPHKYEEGVSPLVQDLVSGRRKTEDLSRAEMELLDRAVLDYAHPSRSKPVTPEPKKPRRKTKPEPIRYPKGDLPKVDGLEPYWWLS
jgi:hypothetical protein